MSLATYKNSLPLADLCLLPKNPKPRWDKKMEGFWDIGEQGAHKSLRYFIDHGLKNYKEGRDFMEQDNVSRLSPRLHFGEISPNQAWHAAKGSGGHIGVETFCKELGWREFSYQLLYYNPSLPHKNLQPRFDHFPWMQSDENLHSWKRGQTGYPIVDAAMRELWETGYMHNRARMIVGSFLVKHLRLHWMHGERWFWDCLFDADLASNSASWQWIAGCGADAAPYFRIFNPVLQGEKFDPNGNYVRRFVPELKDMPDDYIHHPWDAPPMILESAGVKLGQSYPLPIVDHATARDLALAAFKETKSG